MEYSSKLKLSQKYFMASLWSLMLEYWRFHSSRGKEGRPRASRGCLALGAAGASSEAGAASAAGAASFLTSFLASFLGCSGFLGGVLVRAGVSRSSTFSATSAKMG